MTVPFRVEPEPVRRPVQQDPFLEFESERPSRSNLLGTQQESSSSEDISTPALVEPAADRLPSDRRGTSAINPTVAFALGIAGLATAGVFYYQMIQLLAARAEAPPVTAAATPEGALLAAPAPTTGRLEIASDPAGATVTVDGTARGVTPLTLADIAPGTHEVVITREGATVSQSVDLSAGATSVVTAVMTPPVAAAAEAAPAPAGPAGWAIFDAPLELRVLDRGRLRGTTRGRLSLAAGVHELELVNDAYEIRQTVSATIASGRATRLAVPLPSGSLSINAIPWAEVWVDGNPVGITPLANLKVPVGTHEVILRHPSLGERQQSVIVKAVTPARLGINLNR